LFTVVLKLSAGISSTLFWMAKVLAENNKAMII
jgi:hypothetical protein